MSSNATALLTLLYRRKYSYNYRHKFLLRVLKFFRQIWINSVIVRVMAGTIRFADKISPAAKALVSVEQNRLRVSTIMWTTTNLGRFPKDSLNLIFLLMDVPLYGKIQYVIFQSNLHAGTMSRWAVSPQIYGDWTIRLCLMHYLLHFRQRGKRWMKKGNIDIKG